MNPRRSRSLSSPFFFCASVLGVAFLAIASAVAATPQEKVLYNFQGGDDGAFPSSDLIADADGNRFGTTVYGGTGLCTDSDGFVIGCGTVFKLTNRLLQAASGRRTCSTAFKAC